MQVRSTGPVNKYTRQPVKGRKAGGGVRFGEMERDALLAHGVAFILRDRCVRSSPAPPKHASSHLIRMHMFALVYTRARTHCVGACTHTARTPSNDSH